MHEDEASLYPQFFYTASCLQISSIKLVEETEESQQNVQDTESG